MRRAIVHIGTAKTGTTAIQAFCFENAEIISTCGFWYPRPRTPDTVNHVGFALAHGFFRNVAATDETSSNADATFADASSAKANNILISSEHFSVHSDLVPLKRLKRWLDGHGFESVDVVVYLRNQVDWIISAYAESLKWQLTWDLNAFYELNRPRVFYNRILSDWSMIFGESTLDVRSYDEIGMNVVPNFVDSFSSSDQLTKAAEAYPRSHTNLSTSQILLESLRKNTVKTETGEFNSFLVNAALLKRPGSLKELFHRRIWQLPDRFLSDLDDIATDNAATMSRFGLNLPHVDEKSREYSDSVVPTDTEELQVAASWIWKDLR